MKENEIKKIYKKKINQLIKHNQLYFQKNKPSIPDADYDKLKREIFELEIKYKYLNHKNSPRFSVGFYSLSIAGQWESIDSQWLFY